MGSPEPYRASKSVADSTKVQAEAELSDTRKTARDLALKIEELNSRAEVMRQKQQKNIMWYEEEHGVSLKNKKDYLYAQVVKDIECITQKLSKMKSDMTRVLEEKRHADNRFKASSSKKSTLVSVMERIKKEIAETNEEIVLVELARIEVAKEQEIIEAQRKEEENHYQIKLEEVKKTVNEIDQHDELKQELQLTLSNVILLKNELARAKGTKGSPDLLQTITEEQETTKAELESIKREGFNITASMDVIRNKLKYVREEKSCLEKEEEKRDLTLQTLNSNILKAKAELESLTATREKARSVASNISLTVEQLRAETERTKKENQNTINETEKIKLEVSKIESDIELSEERFEAMMEELKTTKSAESTALENLKKLIDSTVRARGMTTLNSSTIKITSFEYAYLTRKAGGAEDIADKKVAAAQAWIEAITTNEKEILMKIKKAKKQIREVSVEVGDHGVGVYGTDAGDRNGARVLVSPQRSVYKMGNMMPGKRARSQKLLLSPATRQAIKSAYFNKKRESVSRNLEKLLEENDEMGE